MDVLDLHSGRPPAPGTSCDVVVARDWEATAWLWDVDARRRVFAVEVLPHHALGPWQAERIAAALSIDLPVDFLAYGAAVADELRDLRPDARVEALRPGLDRPAGPAVPRPRGGDGALRVAVAVEPDGLSAEQADDVLRRTAEPVERTAALDDADVLLCLDPHAPVRGPVLDAAARGIVPVVLPTAPASELAEHLRTGVIAEPDDVRGTARWLDTLARDGELRAALREGALAITAGWPTSDEAAAEERAALGRLLDEEPPRSDRWGARVMADALAAVALWRNEHYELAGELERLRADEAYVLGSRARELWRGDPRLRPVRRVAAPVLRRARRRFGAT